VYDCAGIRTAAGNILISRILRQRMLPERQTIDDEDNAL